MKPGADFRVKIVSQSATIRFFYKQRTEQNHRVRSESSSEYRNIKGLGILGHYIRSNTLLANSMMNIFLNRPFPAKKEHPDDFFAKHFVVWSRK
jgi:hypothetical protein